MISRTMEAQVIRSLVVCGTPNHVKTVPWAAIARDPMI